MDRRQGFLVWVLLLGAVGAGWWWGGRPPDPPPAPVTDPTLVADQSDRITVHVGGWVAVPGLVDLPAEARIADAIAAAGGALPGALLEKVNLAEVVTDGIQVMVPGPAEPGAAPTAAGDAGDGRIHLNRATVAELDRLPGIGPVIAERIVEHRNESGPFTTLEDLLDVPGIGESKLASLRDLVVVP